MDKLIKYWVVLLMLMGLLLSSCSAKKEITIESDSILSEKIIGNWTFNRSFPYVITTFGRDGEYVGKLWETRKQKHQIVTLLGKWWIKDGKLYNTVHQVDPPIIEKIEEPIIDLIVNISENVMTLINDEGKEYKYYRK